MQRSIRKYRADQRGHGIGVSLDVYTKSNIRQKGVAAKKLEDSVLARKGRADAGTEGFVTELAKILMPVAGSRTVLAWIGLGLPSGGEEGIWMRKPVLEVANIALSRRRFSVRTSGVFKKRWVCWSDSQLPTRTP